jgi:hypothetical protein
MIHAFKFSMRIEDYEIDDEHEQQSTVKQNAWYESGVYIIYPENKIGLIWSVLKTIIIFISLFTLSYTAGFRFQQTSTTMQSYEMFFDILQTIDIVLTCFTAKRTREISDQTREYVDRYKAKEDKIQVSIKFESEWEVNIKYITVEYLRTNFIGDFFASIPCLMTGEGVMWLYPLKILRVIRMLRIISFLEQLSAIAKSQYM